MKKTIACILAMALCFTVAACGREEAPPVDTSPAEEVAVETAPVATEPEPTEALTFFSENGIVVDNTYGGVAFDLYSDIHILNAYPSSEGDEVYNSWLDKYFLYEQPQSMMGKYYEKQLTLAKHYGEGVGLQNYETTAQISIYETPIFLRTQYNKIAYSVLCMEGDDPASYPVDVNELEEKTTALHTQYPNHKLISCVVEFDWGTIDNMELFEETGVISAGIGFEMIDKYSGKAFAPTGDATFGEYTVETDNGSYNIAVFPSGAVVLADEQLRAATTISALVPVEYDGTIFAIGDGWVEDSQEEFVVYDHEESPMFGSPNTSYYAYQPMLVDNEPLSALGEALYATAVAADPQATAGEVDVYELEGSYDVAGDVSVAKSTDGSITVVNSKNGYYSVSLFVADSGFNLLYQTGAIAPGEMLSGVTELDSVTGGQYYGIVHYNEAGTAIIVEFLEIW